MKIAVLLYNDVSELEAFGFYSVLAEARAHLPEVVPEEALDLYTVARSRMSVPSLVMASMRNFAAWSTLICTRLAAAVRTAGMSAPCRSQTVVPATASALHCSPVVLF